MTRLRCFLGYSSILRHCRQEKVQNIRTMATNPLIAVCQMTSTGNKAENLKTVKKLSSQAKERSCSIAFFPEACDYLADNKKDIVAMSEPLDGETVSAYKEIAISNNIWLSMGGIHVANTDKRVSNTHILIDNKGDIVSSYRKVHLFDMENKSTGVRLMESDYVVPGPKVEPPICTPIGRLALSICYDMRFPELSLCLRKMGAEILTYPSAFTYQTGASHWEVLLRARAIETQCYVVAAAQTGTHNKKRVSWGHAVIIDPWGTVIAQCMEKTGIAVAEIDLPLLRQIRQNMPCENHRRCDLYPVMEIHKES